MTAKKRNSQHHKEVGQSGSTSSQSILMGSSYVILVDTIPVNQNTAIPLAVQYTFGDYFTWSDQITIGTNVYYQSFSLKQGYFYSIFYRASILSNGQTDPGIQILLNGSSIPDSQIAAPAVTNKPVPLSNSIIVFSSNSNDKFQLASLSAGTVTPQGLNIAASLDPASISISVLGQETATDQLNAISQNIAPEV